MERTIECAEPTQCPQRRAKHAEGLHDKDTVDMMCLVSWFDMFDGFLSPNFYGGAVLELDGTEKRLL